MLRYNDNINKKISIITLHTSVNYGSVLQTYATRRVFEKLGCDVEFVNYIRKINTDEVLAKRMLNKPLYRIVNRCLFGSFDILAYPLAVNKTKKRAKPIRKFINKYIPLTEIEYHSIQELRDNPPIADIYCTGSDQVWNSIWNEGIDLPFYLDYAPNGKKRIAYAASIGRTTIDDDEAKIISELLKKYSYISMREKSGVDLLASIGIASTWVLDPTLMLSQDEWLELSIPKSYKTSRYLLLYILNWNDEIENYAERIAIKHDLEILRICKTNIRIRGIKTIVVNDVEELISYFNDATCVVTDSFHATAFSINLHTNFISVPPPRFKTRIESLLNLVEGMQCYTDCFDINCYERRVDWNKIDGIIEVERRNTLEFLKHAVDYEE